ncbi:N-acyl-D-amino-acid deacylase family protein [Sphingomonas silueang]|uniref:N-acyl-D-amino-acid deacylase family protein n=1 Tax=Sphingomonas silueang TaxID=3156617 RepID=UPI0032B4DE16
MRLGALAALLLLGAAPAPVDVLIRGGIVYPGGAKPFTGDVAIRGDRIVAVGPRLRMRAARTIEAKGMIVAPGFIDPHAHVGDMLTGADAQARLVLPFLMQGVTTTFIGNDGGGDPEVGKVLGSARARPVGINYAAYVGFGAVRQQVIGMARRAPTPDELARMRAIVARAMCEGALGLSTGLFYAPQSFATTDEVVALAREAGTRGGHYDSHIRDESSYTVGLSAAIDEALAIGRQARVPVQISHIKALGVDVQGQAPAIVAKVAAARAAGQRVTADQYPWDASGTSLVASLVPLWAQDGGRQALLARFADPALAARLHADMAENLRKRGGADKLLITEGPHKDRTLAAVAGGGDPVAAAIAVIRVADPAVASFNQRADDIATFMAQPWVMTGSDASPGHPRVYGSFARKYARYVRADHVLTLRQFVDRSATLAADTFGLTDRGRIGVGRYADVVVFDPATYAAQATYSAPTRLASGVRAVLVNGRVAVADGRATGVAAGRALPHAPTGGCR